MSITYDLRRLRFLYAKAPAKPRPSQSKTNDPACITAASEWRRKQATTDTFKKLAACRAAARGLHQASQQRLAGNELKASALEHRVAEGKVGKGQRKALAKDLKGLLEAKRKGRAEDKEKASLAAAVTPKTDENQPTTATPPEAPKVTPETKPKPTAPSAASLASGGIGEYKGKPYKVLWEGQTKYGRRARLGFLDGSKEFWVDASQVRKRAGQQSQDSNGGGNGGGRGGITDKQKSTLRRMLSRLERVSIFDSVGGTGTWHAESVRDEIRKAGGVDQLSSRKASDLIGAIGSLLDDEM